MAPRWIRGIWLGKRFATEEHVVTMPDGSVVRSPAVKPHPEGMWDRDLFDKIRGSPLIPSGQGDPMIEIEVPGDLPRVFARSEREVSEAPKTVRFDHTGVPAAILIHAGVFQMQGDTDRGRQSADTGSQRSMPRTNRRMHGARPNIQ